MVAEEKAPQSSEREILWAIRLGRKLSGTTASQPRAAALLSMKVFRSVSLADQDFQIGLATHFRLVLTLSQSRFKILSRVGSFNIEVAMSWTGFGETEREKKPLPISGVQFLLQIDASTVFFVKHLLSGTISAGATDYATFPFRLRRAQFH